MSQGVAGFQGALARLSGEAEIAVDALMTNVRTMPVSDALAYITEAYPAIADPYIAAAGEMTAQWYGELRERVVRRVKDALTPDVAPMPNPRELGASARWALTSANPQKALSGSTTRRVFNQSRQTVFTNARRDGVRWVRHAGSDACGFCRMLATRVLTTDRDGAPGLYNYEGTANKSPHRKDIRGHDHCKCVATIANGYEIPDYVYDWLEDYDAVSRNDAGVLRPEWNIAYRMERRADDRLGVPRRKRGRPKTKPDPEPTPPPKPDGPGRNTRRNEQSGQFIGDQRLYQRNAARAAEIARSARDRVATANRVAARADNYANQAADITGKVKRVVDAADRIIGGAVPVVRDIKVVVDAADKAAAGATRVTGGAAKTIGLVDKTIKDTANIAHGIKQITDNAVSVVDDAVYVITGAKALAAEATNLTRVTALSVREVDSYATLYTKATAIYERAQAIHGSAEDLIDRARGAVATVRGLPDDIADLPRVFRAPLADTRKLAGAARANVDDMYVVVDDITALARSARSLVDAVAFYRRFGWMPDYGRRSAYAYSQRVTDEIGDLVDGLRPPLPPAAARPPTWVYSERLELPTPPSRPALPAAPVADDIIAEVVDDVPTPPAALPAAPNRLALPPGQSAQAVDDVVDNIPAPSSKALEAPPALRALEPPPAPAQAPRKTRKRRRSLDDIENDFNAAIAAGDDDLIDRLAAEMEDAEQAAARNAARKAKAEAKREAELDRLVASGMDEMEAYQQVYNISAEKMARQAFIAEARASGHRGRGFDELLSSVYHEMVMEEYLKLEDYCRGATMFNKSFYQKQAAKTARKPRRSKAKDAEIQRLVADGMDETEAFQQVYKISAAQDDVSFDPLMLWKVNDAQARAIMSEEAAAWFDENGRLTKSALREAILDGTGNWNRAKTGMSDYLQ